MNEIAAKLGEVGLPEPLSRARRARLGRGRGRRRPQRPDRRGLPRARGQLGARARAPRAPRRRLHARAPVPRRALRRQPVRLRRRPARRARDLRARPAPARLPVLRRRPQPVGPVRGRHAFGQWLDDERTERNLRDLGVVPKDIEGYWAYEHLFDEIRRKLRTGARDTWVGETPTRAEIEELLGGEQTMLDVVFERLDRRGARRPHERPAAEGRAVRPGRDRRLRRAQGRRHGLDQAHALPGRPRGPGPRVGLRQGRHGDGQLRDRRRRARGGRRARLRRAGGGHRARGGRRARGRHAHPRAHRPLQRRPEGRAAAARGPGRARRLPRAPRGLEGPQPGGQVQRRAQRAARLDRGARRDAGRRARRSTSPAASRTPSAPSRRASAASPPSASARSTSRPATTRRPRRRASTC